MDERCCRTPSGPNPKNRIDRRRVGLALLGAALAAAGLTAGPSAPTAEASSCANAGAKPGKLSGPEARKAVRCLINEKRAKAGMGALDRDRRLQKSAQRHNKRMHGTGCFAHQCPGEGSLDTRIRNTGYLSGADRWKYAENVAWGKKKRGTPKNVVDAWMKSSGHRANILSRDFRDLGVGFDNGTPGSKRASGGIFTVDFGMAVG
ncbi:MAG: CAP domain-containing protein [Solirubrobacterales bacterium]